MVRIEFWIAGAPYAGRSYHNEDLPNERLIGTNYIPVPAKGDRVRLRGIMAFVESVTYDYSAILNDDPRMSSCDIRVHLERVEQV